MNDGEHTSGQNAAYWATTCENLAQRMKAYALRLANGRKHDAEDLVQETVCRALTYARDPAEIRNPLGYLLSMMRNHWKTNWRKEKAASTESLEVFLRPGNSRKHPTVEPDVFRILENKELAISLKNLPGSLTDRERLLLKSYLAGFRSKEIARLLNEDVRITRSDLNAVKAKIRLRIKRGIKRPPH